MGDGGQVAGALTWTPEIHAWLADQPLGQIPIVSGMVTWTIHQPVPGTLQIKVPAGENNQWNPGEDPAHPLACYGQTLDVRQCVKAVSTGQEWTIRLGVFTVQAWEETGDGAIQVNAVSQTQRLIDARLLTAQAPRPGSTLASEAARLLPDGMGLIIGHGLEDRACPESMVWGEDRLEALQEIGKAWPARIRETVEGDILLLPPLDGGGIPAGQIRDGEGGTVVAAPRTDSRHGVYNQVVARSIENQADKDLPAFQAVATHTAGPLSATGPYGLVNRAYSSPLITSVGVAEKTAQSMLENSLRSARTRTILCAPDPRWELDDLAAVTYRGETTWETVDGIDWPLTVGDGQMRIMTGVAG